jgi:hypothetical protein
MSKTIIYITCINNKKKSILTTVVGCGGIHELVVGCDIGIVADVGGEISLFVDDKLSIAAPVVSKFKI